MSGRIPHGRTRHQCRRLPILYLIFVDTTDLQYDEGQPYAMALARTEDEGYRPSMVAFDQNDTAAGMLRLAVAFMEGDADEV